MSTTQELRKPRFVKVKDLERERSGYNVYVKIISADIRDIETRDGLKIRMVDAVVGDQTAIAKAFFKGENATLIEKGSVIAIRNGLKKYIKNFISLELDIFGRVTKESVEINVNESYNISEQEHKLPERKPRGPRNFSQARRNNRQGGNRRPERRNDERPTRRTEGTRQEPRGERPPRREREGRTENREGRNQNREGRPQNREGRTENREERFERREGRTGERRERKYDDRPQRREYNRSYDRDFDRRREDDNRPQRRQQQRYEPRRQQYRDRAPTQWTKIDQISPGDDRLNIIVKVLSQELVKGRNRDMLRCTVGDETGVVRAFLSDSPALRVGKSVTLFDCEARVVKEHIEIQCRGRIEEARKFINRVNQKFNLSDKSWVPVNQ